MSSHAQMKWDASQGKWIEIGPDHPHGLPYEPGQAANESLDLKVGDWIVWEDAEIKSENGPAIVSPGMKGQVISLHDGFHLDVIEGGAIPASALVEFESGENLLIDKMMKLEKVSKQ